MVSIVEQPHKDTSRRGSLGPVNLYSHRPMRSCHIFLIERVIVDVPMGTNNNKWTAVMRFSGSIEKQPYSGKKEIDEDSLVAEKQK